MTSEEQAVQTENKPIENNIPQPIKEENIKKESDKTETETQEQINWRKFREAREIERKQKLEAERRAAEKEAEAAALKAALEAMVTKPQATSYEQEEESEEARLERLVNETLEKRKRKEEEERKIREQAELPDKLRNNFHDFNQVCTTENLDYLEYHYPEVASAFKNLPDTYDKWANIYKAVKRFIPNALSKKDVEKAEKNLMKPQAMSIAGKTQTGDSAPIQLDEKRRMQNWERMQRVMKGL